MMDVNNKILIAINQKNKKLYRHLYDFYYPSLCRYGSKYISDTNHVEDIVQDVFLKLWESDTNFNNIRAVTTYLYRSVYNSCLNVIRDNKLIYTYDEINVSLAEGTLTTDEYHIVEEEYYRLIFTVIYSLTPQRRDIILLALQGKKNEEIALMLNISVNTVKTLKKKAYNDMRLQLPPPVSVFLLHFLKINK